MEYPKIQTVFKRDERNIIIPSLYTLPEIEYLKNNIFECTEKIDGTNIRIEVQGKEITFKGRTNKANIPSHLLSYLQNTFTPEKVFKALNIDPEIGTNDNTMITIYGEGYGVKIQAGGNYIKDGVGFILFDVKVDKWWLKRQDCEQVAQKLECKIVPIIGHMTLLEAIEYVKKGFKSTIAENKDYDAEGLVLRTTCGLLDRSGQRLIFKLKTRDFKDWDKAYGQLETPPNQIINSHYEEKL